LFKQAVANSPAKSVDIVVANAGITGPDEIFTLEGNQHLPPSQTTREFPCIMAFITSEMLMLYT
jgi:hypothetical protein